MLLVRNRYRAKFKCNPPQSAVLQGLSCLIFALTPVQGAKVLQGRGHSGGVHLGRPVPAPILPCVERQVVLGVGLVLLPVLGDLQGKAGLLALSSGLDYSTCQIGLFLSSIDPNSLS